jgi:hypothetical protein
MSEAKLRAARDLIDADELDAARGILITIIHAPEAQRLLEEIDDIRDEKYKNDDYVSLGDLIDEKAKVYVSRPQRDYALMAVFTLILYWVLWLPGLIMNLFMLNEVREYERETGVTPQGKGCLMVLLIFNILPFACCGLIFLLALTAPAV